MPDPTSPAVDLVDGPEFVVAPPNRLFAAFDDPGRALDAVRTLTTGGLANSEVWIYVGEDGAQRIDPSITHHGPGVALVRLAQRLLTWDCEYCEQLEVALHAGGMVVAVELSREMVSPASDIFEAHGGHSIAYGEHWNFEAVDAPK